MLEAMDKAHAGLAESMGKPGWTYRDIRWLTIDLWTQLVELTGEDNIRFIAGSERVTDNGTMRRGQVLISPEGMRRIREHPSAPTHPENT